jgi:Flp pilus assembly pilin Flp
MKKFTNFVSKESQTIGNKFNELWLRSVCSLRDEKGQSTVEYAILVGILVVIAIIAIVAFRSKIEQLWQMIADAVNSL